MPSLDNVKWLSSLLEEVRLHGRPLSSDQKAAFLLTGQLPEGAEYPAIMDTETWGNGSRTQALLFAGTARGKGVASGPYAVATGDENFFAARQIRPKL